VPWRGAYGCCALADGKVLISVCPPAGRSDSGEAPVDDDREARVWASIRLQARPDAASVTVLHACLACARAVTAMGVSLSLVRAGGLGEPVCATGLVSEELAELQFTLGQGPCVDALRGPTPILVADLADEGSGRRWPMFAPAAAQQGVRAVFSLPLRAGAIRAGVMEVYRDRPGLLSGDELADALVYADAALLLTLGTAEGIATERPQVSTGDGFDERRAEVHQAAGMISVQLRVGVEEALVRLRAFAYAQDRRLVEVARDVVERRLRFADEGGGIPVEDDDSPEQEAES
jgi:hypothetical protein